MRLCSNYKWSHHSSIQLFLGIHFIVCVQTNLNKDNGSKVVKVAAGTADDLMQEIKY